jgi:hypothetical protein
MIHRFAIFGLLLAATAQAQIPTFVPGQTLTAAQLNAANAALQAADAAGVARDTAITAVAVAAQTTANAALTGGIYQNVTGTTYTTLATDGFVAVNSASPVTITLVTAPPVGTTQTVNDIAGLAASANITVQPSSGTISGFTNVILTQAHMSMDFTFTSSGWIVR